MDGIFDITTKMADLTDFVQKTMTQAAQSKAIAQVATVVAVSGGSLDLKLPSGVIVRGVDNGTRQRFPVGSSVTIEQGYPGMWQVVGAGAAQSE